MFNFQTAMAGAIALSTLFFANPLLAMTLVANSRTDFKLEQGYKNWHYGYGSGDNFQQTLQPTWGAFNKTGGMFNGTAVNGGLTRRWVSDFDGKVQFELDFLGQNDSGLQTELLQQIAIDGRNVVSDRSKNLLNQNFYRSGIFDVQAGTTIDFDFAPTNSNWQGAIDFGIKIEGEETTEALPAPPKPCDLCDRSGLVFITSSEERAVHVALARNGTVYESDPIAGVRTQSLTSFLANKNYQFKGISADHAVKMAEFIEEHIGAGYLPPSASVPIPCEQKGYCDPKQFTHVGLIERAAEEALVNGGQGYIPNYLEFIQTYSSGMTSLLTVYFMNYLMPEFNFYYEQKSAYPQNYFGFQLNPKNWFSGEIEASDFIITDPQGRRMGYVSELGFFNNIPDLVYSSENLNFLADTSIALASSTLEPITGRLSTTAGYAAPNSLSEAYNLLKYPDFPNLPPGIPPLSDSKSVFRFTIEDRLPGEYKIEKWNRNYTHDISIRSVPEPIATFGLLATAGLFFVKRRSKL